MPEHASQLRQGFVRHAPWLLILSCLALFTTKAAFNLPLLVMAIAGLVIGVRQRGIWRQPMVKEMLLLFVCLWVPIVASLPDAVMPERAVSTAIRYLGFPLAGLYVIHVLRHAWVRDRLPRIFFIMVVLWVFDGLFQFVFGVDVFGRETMGVGRLTGMFPGLRFTHVLAVVSPLMFWMLLNSPRRSPWLRMGLFLALLLVLVVGGSRSAWLMSLVVMGVYCFVLLRDSDSRKVMRYLAVGLVVMLVVVLIAFQSNAVRHRMAQTAGVFSGDLQQFDTATSNRLSIWKVGMKMFIAHPVNGVGPRGFRYDFERHASKDNRLLQGPEKGATHPHLFMLEVAAETGSIGLAGLLILFVLLLRRVWRLMPAWRDPAFAWSLAALVAFFPLNAHMALYGSYWGSLAWLLLVIALGMSQASSSSSSVGRSSGSS